MTSTAEPQTMTNEIGDDPSNDVSMAMERKKSEEEEVTQYIENYQNDIRCSQNIMEFVDQVLIEEHKPKEQKYDKLSEK